MNDLPKIILGIIIGAVLAYTPTYYHYDKKLKESDGALTKSTKDVSNTSADAFYLISSVNGEVDCSKLYDSTVIDKCNFHNQVLKEAGLQ